MLRFEVNWKQNNEHGEEGSAEPGTEPEYNLCTSEIFSDS